MQKFNKNRSQSGDRSRGNPNNRYKKPNNRPQRPKIDYNELFPSKVDTSRTLLASFVFRTVRSRPGEATEALLKRFKMVIEKAGVISEIKRRECYKSKGEKAREKSMKAQKRARKNLQKSKRFD